jgi:hypothetical protein
MANNISILNAGRVFIGLVAFIVLFKFLTGSGSDYPSHYYSFSNYRQATTTTNRNGFLPIGPDLEEMCLHYRWKPFPDRYNEKKSMTWYW